MVYVAALVPEEGQNVSDVNAAMPTTGVERAFQLSPDGFLSLQLEGINEHFAQDVSPSERKVIFASQGTWALSATQGLFIESFFYCVKHGFNFFL